MYTFDWLAKQADMRPDKCALIDAATGRSYTYADFHLRASRFAEFLRDEWRVQPGERIALLAPNSSDYFEILWGCAKMGAILVCLNWRLAVPELEEMMRDSTPVALIYDPAFAAQAAALKAKLGIDRMMEVMEQAGHLPPSFDARPYSFAVTLYNSREKQAIPDWVRNTNHRQARALQYIRDHGSITNREYRSLCQGVSAETLRLDLADMVERGILLKVGSKKGTYYILK